MPSPDARDATGSPSAVAGTGPHPPPPPARVLTPAMVDQIRAFFPRYPTRQAVVLPALHVVHRQLRHVPLEAVVEIAALLGLAPAQVQDTLTFYGFFRQQAPHGRRRAWICRSISCALRGGEGLLDEVCRQLGIAPGETSDDGRLTVEGAECLGACELAPCMLLDDQLCPNLDSDTVRRHLHLPAPESDWHPHDLPPPGPGGTLDA